MQIFASHFGAIFGRVGPGEWRVKMAGKICIFPLCSIDSIVKDSHKAPDVKMKTI